MTETPKNPPSLETSKNPPSLETPSVRVSPEAITLLQACLAKRHPPSLAEALIDAEIMQGCYKGRITLPPELVIPLRERLEALASQNLSPVKLSTEQLWLVGELLSAISALPGLDK